MPLQYVWLSKEDGLTLSNAHPAPFSVPFSMAIHPSEISESSESCLLAAHLCAHAHGPEEALVSSPEEPECARGRALGYKAQGIQATAISVISTLALD